MTPEDLFACGGLISNGPIAWKTKCPETSTGVYIIATEADGVVYIGRTRQTLAKRLDQFYRHKIGARSPHRGGQNILQLTGPLLVYWSATDNPTGIERLLIDEFQQRHGRFPLGNLKSGDARVRG
jgi:hypothetical protein